jgi:hypothetical protein
MDLFQNILDILSFVVYGGPKGDGVRFWELVASHPAEAYEFFTKNACLLVVYPDEKKGKPKSGGWTGPYFFNMPDIGKLKIYGRAGEFEKKQEEFIERMKERHSL